MNNKVHLATDIEKYVWSLFEGRPVLPNTTEWRLRDKLLTIVKRWKSSEYRLRAVYRVAQHYIGIYYLDRNDETIKWAINTCSKLGRYIEENS